MPKLALVITFIVACWMAVTGPKAPQPWVADAQHCLPVVQAPAGAYPRWQEYACDNWNAIQAANYVP